MLRNFYEYSKWRLMDVNCDKGVFDTSSPHPSLHTKAQEGANFHCSPSNHPSQINVQLFSVTRTTNYWKWIRVALNWTANWIELNFDLGDIELWPTHIEHWTLTYPHWTLNIELWPVFGVCALNIDLRPSWLKKHKTTSLERLSWGLRVSSFGCWFLVTVCASLRSATHVIH